MQHLSHHATCTSDYSWNYLSEKFGALNSPRQINWSHLNLWGAIARAFALAAIHQTHLAAWTLPAKNLPCMSWTLPPTKTKPTPTKNFTYRSKSKNAANLRGHKPLPPKYDLHSRSSCPAAGVRSDWWSTCNSGRIPANSPTWQCEIHGNHEFNRQTRYGSVTMLSFPDA